MSNQITNVLKAKLEEIRSSNQSIGIEVQRNASKEVLQYFVLDFIYHHPAYSNWIMYGGSALRICHGLDRMSVDLDFEVENEVTSGFLKQITKEILIHFEKTYGIGSDVLTTSITNNRGITLKFHIGEELGLSFHSKQIHVKIDLNHFSIHPKIVTERWPQNEYQLSFVIKTYNMSALMASKIAALFLRGRRGVGENIYEEKGRDIYDLLWYMGKGIVPDLDYLKAKNVEEAKDFRTLFDKLVFKMGKVSEQNLKEDLSPLFTNQTFIENWIKNWRELFMRYLEHYEVHTATSLQEVVISRDDKTDVFSFHVVYHTEDNKTVTIRYHISGFWIDDKEGDLSVKVSEEVKKVVEFSFNGTLIRPSLNHKLMQYAELFYQKSERYLKSTQRVLLGRVIETKFIRMTSDSLNQKEQILLNASALLSCDLEDLFK